MPRVPRAKARRDGLGLGPATRAHQGADPQQLTLRRELPAAKAAAVLPEAIERRGGVSRAERDPRGVDEALLGGEVVALVV